jgi:hypothetical protein
MQTCDGKTLQSFSDVAERATIYVTRLEIKLKIELPEFRDSFESEFKVTKDGGEFDHQADIKWILDSN